ncbi:unnamed protein product, partial [Pelagomonas calceolata]
TQQQDLVPAARPPHAGKQQVRGELRPSTAPRAVVPRQRLALAEAQGRHRADARAVAERPQERHQRAALAREAAPLVRVDGLPHLPPSQPVVVVEGRHAHRGALDEQRRRVRRRQVTGHDLLQDAPRVHGEIRQVHGPVARARPPPPRFFLQDLASLFCQIRRQPRRLGARAPHQGPDLVRGVARAEDQPRRGEPVPQPREAVHVAETTQTRPEDGPLRRARLLVVVRRPPFVGRGRHGQAEPPRELGLQDGGARVVVARDHYETVAVAQHLERAPCPGGRDEERCEACHWAALICCPARRRRVACVAAAHGTGYQRFRPQRE